MVVIPILAALIVNIFGGKDKTVKAISLVVAIAIPIIAIIAAVLGGHYHGKSQDYTLIRVLEMRKDSIDNIIVGMNNNLASERESKKEIIRQIQDTAKKYNETNVLNYIEFVNLINQTDN